jgi:hypothetical protein
LVTQALSDGDTSSKVDLGVIDEARQAVTTLDGIEHEKLALPEFT